MGKAQSSPSRPSDLPSYSRYSETRGNGNYTHYNGRTIGYGNSILIGRQKLAEVREFTKQVNAKYSTFNSKVRICIAERA